MLGVDITLMLCIKGFCSNLLDEFVTLPQCLGAGS